MYCLYSSVEPVNFKTVMPLSLSLSLSLFLTFHLSFLSFDPSFPYLAFVMWYLHCQCFGYRLALSPYLSVSSSFPVKSLMLHRNWEKSEQESIKSCSSYHLLVSENLFSTYTCVCVRVCVCSSCVKESLVPLFDWSIIAFTTAAQLPPVRVLWGNRGWAKDFKKWNQRDRRRGKKKEIRRWDGQGANRGMKKRHTYAYGGWGEVMNNMKWHHRGKIWSTLLS